MKSFGLLALLFLSYNVLAQNAKAPVTVYVTDYEDQAIANDKIIFMGQKSKKAVFGITDASGKFTVLLPEGDLYEIKIDAIGDELDYNTLEIPSLPEGAAFQNMELSISYSMGDSFTLSDLNFETGKSIIQPSSYGGLNKLVDYLKRKKGLNIEIGGHTDNVGSEAGNLKLSKERALAVKAYLVKKGIAAGRIRTQGYGMNVPIADNSSPTGRAQNRRTEVRIIE